MKEKIKIMLSLVIFLFLFPYIVTVFFQGTPVAGESVYETATETAVMAQGSMPKEREQLIAILAKEIHVDSERETIRAQAVIARANYDYAVAAGREPESGLSVQEMMAAFGEKNFATDYQILADAVDDTADITVSYGGNTTLMLPYHAVSAGKTRTAAELPYLTGVDSQADLPSEDYLKVIYFEKTEFLAQLEQIFPNAAFQETDPVSQIAIDGRDDGGYVTSVTVCGTTVSGDEFRDRFGLASACFTIAEVDGRVRVVTKGLGHGYGLSQWGANELAKDGKDCVEILKYYFPNIEITE